MMRILEEVGRILARITSKRRKGDTDDAALETVILGLQRLFGADADQIFLLTPEQHFEMLADDETPGFARDKVVLYAALCAEAGHIYTRQGNRTMARATFTTALRFMLKARRKFPADGMPDYAPEVGELLAALAGEPLDAETASLVSDQAG